MLSIRSSQNYSELCLDTSHIHYSQLRVLVNFLHFHHQFIPIALVLNVMLKTLLIGYSESFKCGGFTGGLIEPIGLGFERLIDQLVDRFISGLASKRRIAQTKPVTHQTKMSFSISLSIAETSDWFLATSKTSL